MRTLVVLLACLALTAGYGVNWGVNRDRDLYTKRMNTDEGFFKDFMFNYMNDYRSNYETNKHVNQDIIADRNIFKDSVTTDSFEYGRDLKSAIMNDKDIFRKQKFVLDIMRNVYTTLVLDDVRDIHFIEGESFYHNYERLIPFFKMFKSKSLLTRGRVFTLSNLVHRHQAIALFNLFYYSKDFNVFQKNVLWARNYINEDMFIYVLTAAIFHRPDMAGVKLPSYYEVVPHKFHTGFTLTNALNKRLSNIHDNVVIVRNNYTSDIMVLNEESKLAYFTEDISWNMYHFYLYLGYPYWLGGEDFELYKEHRGERMLFLIQQLLARYYMERLSHGLGEIDDISFNVPVKTGYNSFLKHFNGIGFSVRKNYYDVLTSGGYYLINRVEDFERRLRDAIDTGYVIGKDGGKIDLSKADGIDILGNLIQSNKDSVNDRYYGGVIRFMRLLFGGGYEKNVDFNTVLPSVMEYYETALRDPVTYQLYKRILNLYYQYKNYLHPYTKDDLFLKGVRVLDVKTSKLATFFDYFDVDVSNIVNKDFVTPSKTNVDHVTEEKVVMVRHTRLNHKPFTVNIDVDSEQAQRVVVRLFLAPKFDEFGKIISLNDNRYYFLELDKFVYDLPAGRVTIKRDSHDFQYYVSDRTTYLDLYKKILMNKDLNTLLEMNIVESHCGFPDRLMLPRGWVGGMPMQFFVIVTRPTKFEKGEKHLTKCGRDSTWFHVDDYHLGFPFDRHIHEGDFYTTNMIFKDTFIYHEGQDFNRGYDDFVGTHGHNGEFIENKLLHTGHY